MLRPEHAANTQLTYSEHTMTIHRVVAGTETVTEAVQRFLSLLLCNYITAIAGTETVQIPYRNRHRNRFGFAISSVWIWSQEPLFFIERVSKLKLLQ